MELKVGDYVLPTIKEWADKGFTQPKQIFSIKNNYANLAGRFNSCYVGYLKKVENCKTPLIYLGEVSITFNSRENNSIRFWFGKVKLYICNN